MHQFPLLRLIRHAFIERTAALEWIPVVVNKEVVFPTDDPADRFTGWPPQPMIAWLESDA